MPKLKFIFGLFITIPVFIICVEKVRYISVEHPTVLFANPVYLKNVKLTCQRYGRKNPVYYVGLAFDLIQPFDNRIQVDFYFDEFLSNTYKRSFVEMHFRWCDLIFKDKFFGAALKQGNLTKPCPHQPGYYNLVNMTIPPASIPKAFPFTKGRIWANFTDTKKNELFVSGYVDMELREIKKSNSIKFTDTH